MTTVFRDPEFFKPRYWQADPFAHLRPPAPEPERFATARARGFLLCSSSALALCVPR